MNPFSAEIRVLTCPQCGAPVQTARLGGQFQCGYCRTPLVAAARDDVTIEHAGPVLTEQERMQSLWAQSRGFGAKLLPPEMRQVLTGGALTSERIGGALAIWRMYCQQASAGDANAGEYAVLITGSISSYFLTVAKDPHRQRALFESTLDALRRPEQKQVIRCLLARSSAKAGDLASARTWFGACDPRSADLQADTAYRATYAYLATSHGDFGNVLAALGPTPESIPVAVPSLLLIDVLRANALEKRGDIATAVMQLVADGQRVPGAKEAIPDIVEAHIQLQLCPNSLPAAMQRW